MSLQHIFQALLYLAMGIILAMATSTTDHSAATGINDKVGHILAFILLGLLAQQAFPRHRMNWILYAWLLAYGLAIELIQYFIPERSFSLLDLAADATGLVVAFILMQTLKPAARVR